MKISLLKHLIGFHGPEWRSNEGPPFTHWYCRTCGREDKNRKGEWRRRTTRAEVLMKNSKTVLWDDKG